VVVYELVEADSSGDGKLTASDMKTIAVSDPAGSRFTRVVTGVEDINATTLTKSGRVLILYTASSVLKAAEIEVETQKVVRDAPLQTIAAKKQEEAAAQR
jgi:hypothetical protein